MSCTSCAWLVSMTLTSEPFRPSSCLSIQCGLIQIMMMGSVQKFFDTKELETFFFVVVAVTLFKVTWLSWVVVAQIKDRCLGYSSWGIFNSLHFFVTSFKYVYFICRSLACEIFFFFLFSRRFCCTL